MYDRRQFLTGSLGFALLPPALREFAGQAGKSSEAKEFSISDRELLGAAMDTVIPADNDLPSASAVGGLMYLQSLVWQYRDIGDQIRAFLDRLAQTSASQFHGKFTDMHLQQRVQALAALEKEETSTFAAFVGFVYESYYTAPRVRGLIWCPTASSSPEDIEELLGPVRKLPRLYREVP